MKQSIIKKKKQSIINENTYKANIPTLQDPMQTKRNIKCIRMNTYEAQSKWEGGKGIKNKKPFQTLFMLEKNSNDP